jgi:hypothetical protein
MRIRRILAVIGSAMVLGAPLAAFAASPDSGTVLSVSVQGWLPGFDTKDLPPFIAEEMNAAAVAGWRFAPAGDGASQAPNRVEWRFKPNPYAGGPTLHRLGFVREIDQIFGVHRPISVEVRLYINGEYQLLESAEPTLQGGTRDPDLRKQIVTLTQSLASAANPGTPPKS